MVDSINWTKGDFEIRTVSSLENGEPYVELIKWTTDEHGRRYCFTLAYFRKNSDGDASLIFVGDRPFRYIADIDINEVWKELFLTQLILQGEVKDD